MRTVPILEAPERRWECPTCGRQHVTREHRPHTPMHHCAGLAGLWTPFVAVHGRELARHSVRHVAVEREDYVAGERGIRYADGRAVMAIRVERADGSNDCHVFAPVATAAAAAYR